VTSAALTHFSAPVREWVERAFGEPTPEEWLPEALDALAEFVRGFRSGPRRLTLSA
jgi:hypothetical protein